MLQKPPLLLRDVQTDILVMIVVMIDVVTTGEEMTGETGTETETEGIVAEIANHHLIIALLQTETGLHHMCTIV